MRAYITLAWVLEGVRWYSNVTLEEAKDYWCDGYIIFKVPPDELDNTFKNVVEVEKIKDSVKYLTDKYGIVSKTGIDIYAHHLDRVMDKK